jgi:hypothetical protein
MKRFALVLFLLFAPIALAGGPLFVAGSSGFQAGLSGTPITWANGQLNYYTDQGSLSPLLSNVAANQMVADAFAKWTSIATASVSANRLGSLNEDVNGTNVTLIQGALSLPNDLLPTSGKPLAIVYDYDGKVFDALLGGGAGAPELCETNAIYVVSDKISDDAHFAHAMVFLNGNCAKFASDLPILRYKLARALGQVLGLDYSQLNDNVVTGAPGPSIDDYAGFPLMHPLAVLCNEYACQADAEQPRMDDRAALSRLYPVTSANLSSGKLIFRDTTARVHGTVRFPAWKGTLGQGMQGVNVVARMIDPVTGRISRRYTASSVSGFLFRGRAGNPITGYYDVLGRRLDRYGSNNPALEGSFDLSGLEVPGGYSSVTYEIGVEPVNSLYVDSNSVGPYKQGQVSPSGTWASVRVTIPKGGEVAQDISMQKAANEAADNLEPHSFLFPTAVPGSGTWMASISGYGDLDYFYFSARANRSFTFDVISLDAFSNATTAKLQPVLGVWSGNDLEDSPRLLESYFNSSVLGTTRLQATVTGAGEYKLGVADARGDGRPDFQYQARLLYADDIAPARASVRGGTGIALSGMGFSSNMQVLVGSAPVNATTVNPNRIQFNSPELPDGTYTLVVRDMQSGATAQIDNALRVGGSDARLNLLSGGNPQVPVGTQAPNPMRVQVVDTNTGEPVAGATVLFTVPNSAAIAGCAVNPCSFITDQNGSASASVVIKAAGPSVIVAALPSGSNVSTTVNGMAAAMEISIANPSVNVGAGATATVSATATVVANGVPALGKTVNFLLNTGAAIIAPGSAATDSNGNATVNVSVKDIASDVNISACVTPNNAPCLTLIIHAVPLANLIIQRVSGDHQSVSVGQPFAPMTVRVVDTSGNPVLGVPVTFIADIYRVGSEAVREQRGEVVTSTRDEVVVLATAIQSTASDASGLATLNFNAGQNQPVQVAVRAVAGTSVLNLNLQTVWAQSPAVPVPGSANAPFTSSDTNQPTHSLSCTKAGCSAASRSSVLRRGNKASSKAPSISGDK